MKIKRYLIIACVILGIMWFCVYSFSDHASPLEDEVSIDLSPGILNTTDADNSSIESNMTNRSHRMDVLLEDSLIQPELLD